MFYFIIIFGACWSGIALYIMIMGMRSSRWPLTTGKIISSEVRTIVSRGRHGSTTYRPFVDYEYFVNGIPMRSERLAFGDRLQTSRTKAQQLLQNYPAGKNIPVHYNPKKPSQSVLIAGNPYGIYVALVFGFFIIALGIAGIYLKWN